MLYKPQKGQIKDGCMIYEKGTYYLFSMYHKENSDKYNNVWLATSKDGVHFEDYGCVVEDFPDFIWAMKVYRGDDAFYMNSGSFSETGKQAVLKFWKSTDLLSWEYQPELDVEAPCIEDDNTRLDCMNVVRYNEKYYGYATGQYSYLTSDDGAHWRAYPSNISYYPFPQYNKALGGFEVADCIELDNKFYMFCGGFGHLGMNGYGVYVYESEKPEGPFTTCLPYYRINGTSKRWVNMWERFFEKDGQYLAHNYMYDGYSYENGNVYLPTIKKLEKENNRLYLTWWNGNDILTGDIYGETNTLQAESLKQIAYEKHKEICAFSDTVSMPDKAVIDLTFTLSKNSFVNYSCGGIYLAEDENSGTAVLFDTYGKCDIARIENGEICEIEDSIGFGSSAPYYIESGKTYSVRILTKGGMFEIYVNGEYLQTFNNAHFTETESKPFIGLGAIAVRNSCTITDIKIYNLAI